jgi:hypothetical protein
LAWRKGGLRTEHRSGTDGYLDDFLLLNYFFRYFLDKGTQDARLRGFFTQKRDPVALAIGHPSA